MGAGMAHAAIEKTISDGSKLSALDNLAMIHSVDKAEERTSQ
jgi:hypothetical protein